MITRNIINFNTPERYDNIYMGPRTNEILAVPDVYHIMSMMVKKDKECKVLDLGCGLGRYFPCFNDCDITGIELSLKAIAKAKEDYPNAHISQYDLNKNIPFENETYDYIYAGELLEHVENPQFIVDECYRVLKPKGIIFANTPYMGEIPCEEHMWEFDLNDMKTLFNKFTKKSILRFCVDPNGKWEHFLVIAEKV